LEAAMQNWSLGFSARSKEKVKIKAQKSYANEKLKKSQNKD